MLNDISISIVVPTCNRKASLFRLLRSLQQSEYNILEVIVVDSGDDQFSKDELDLFSSLHIVYIRYARSVCIQRNIGIKSAKGSWVFLCDDDLEVPSDYLTKIVNHIHSFPQAGAITGVVLQKDEGTWTEQYPIQSAFHLLHRFIFQLSIWGSIDIKSNNIVISAIKNFYKKKGNHLSKAGWPILTDFSGDHFKTPVYGLGASVVRRDWLLNSPYEEVLDANGIGDNYGVALGFPSEGIHVVKTAFVYHHQASENRLHQSIGYYRRVLALHYFIKTKKPAHVRMIWFLWSLVGNLLLFAYGGNMIMIKATMKVMMKVVVGNNPYLIGKRSGAKVIVPEL